MGFLAHENPKSSFRVLNKFGSSLPLVLLLTWGCCYCLLSFFFSLGACYSSPLLASVLFVGDRNKMPTATSTSTKDFIVFENFQNICHIS
jgi:hypothetical protein